MELAQVTKRRPRYRSRREVPPRHTRLPLLFQAPPSLAFFSWARCGSCCRRPKPRAGSSRLGALSEGERHRGGAPLARGRGVKFEGTPHRVHEAPTTTYGWRSFTTRQQPDGAHGGEAKAEGFLKDDTTATPATRMFATMTGNEWITTPVQCPQAAAIPCTAPQPYRASW